MGDLISRSRLKAELDAWAKIIINPQYYHKEDADFVIDSQAAVDIVPCKECVYWRRDMQINAMGRCRQYSVNKYENGYCDRGERIEK